MEYTSNYQLPVWAESDRILRTDFNGMTSAIDSALKTNADGLAAETSARQAKDAEHAAFGNCQLYAISYVGTDTASVTHTFPKLPRLVMVMGGGSWVIITIQGADCGIFRTSMGMYSTLNASWSGNSVTFQEDAAHEVCNMAGTTYQLLALLEA